MSKLLASRAVIVVVAVAALTLGGTLAAQAAVRQASSTTSPVVHGCLNGKTEQLVKIWVSGTHSCSTGTSAIKWNEQGPQGARGPTGLRGPQGLPASACQATDGSHKYANLQTAITNASSGDTLVVSGSCDGIFTFSPVSASTLTIDGSPTATLNGEALGTTLAVGSNGTLILDNVVVTGGGGASTGGGIVNQGTLTIEGTSEVNDNANVDGGAGIVNYGTLTLQDSAQVDNNTTAYDAGGIDNLGGTVTLEGSSQVDNNTAADYAGGISTFGGTLTLEDSSQVDNNTAVADSGGGILNNGNSPVIILEGSSQVDGNTAPTDPGVSGTFTLNPNTGDNAQVADNNT